MIEISYSSLSTFKSCHKKYDWKQNLRLQPKKEPIEISIGKAIHEAFYSYFSGTNVADCSKMIREKFDDIIASCQNAWEYEDLVISKYTALGMWDHYPFNLVNFEKIYPERQFKIRVPGTSVHLVGFLDGLFTDGGKYWIREVKTTGSDLRQVKARADVSYQGTGYVWAMQEILGERIQGIFYDLIRKPLLRKNQAETAQDFAERCFKYYSDRSNIDKLYSRHYSYRSNDVINLFKEDLIADAKEIEAVKTYTRNPDSCFMYNRECPFKRICFMENVDSDTIDNLFERRERHVFQEETNNSAD